MSISLVSNATATSALATPQPISRRQQEDIAGRQLEQALQSGDLTTATQAYDQLAAFGPNNSGPFQSPALQQGFLAVGQALQAGDLGAAQQAASTVSSGLLQKDYNIAKQDYKSGGLQGAQQAIANLEGDYWAVTGQGAPPA
ncbi:MAG: hypothetical protein WBM11_08350, partial [Terriglobales bacterium]